MKKLNLLLIVFPLLTWAHGEDKPGPHGGFIKMPGAFHTEVLAAGKNKLKVYLLDMQWKNPSIVKSELKVTHNKKTKGTCGIKENYYECGFPTSVNLNTKGELSVTAQRDGQVGNEMIYALPLKLEAPKNDDHSGHH